MRFNRALMLAQPSMHALTISKLVVGIIASSQTTWDCHTHRSRSFAAYFPGRKLLVCKSDLHAACGRARGRVPQ